MPTGSKPDQEIDISYRQQDGRVETQKPLDVIHGDIEFKIFSGMFLSFFVPVFPHCAKFLPFWNGNICYVSFISEVCNFSYDFREYDI